MWRKIDEAVRCAINSNSIFYILSILSHTTYISHVYFGAKHNSEVEKNGRQTRNLINW